MNHPLLTLPATGAALPCEGAGATGSAPSQSALGMARDAIARWRGAPLPAHGLARDLTRVSPQARWLAEAHAGLSTWIAHGGFSQREPAAAAAGLLPPLPGPVMYRLPLAPRSEPTEAAARICRLN